MTNIFSTSSLLVLLPQVFGRPVRAEQISYIIAVQFMGRMGRSKGMALATSASLAKANVFGIEIL